MTNHPFRRFRCLFSVGLFALAGLSFTADAGQAPANTNNAAQSSLGKTWLPYNPYRQATPPQVIETGHAAFNRHCAECHGVDTLGNNAAPNLRRLDGFCRKLKSGELKETCMRDVDAYFKTSVLEGKIRLGVVHMPALEGVLTQETIWAIKSYIESKSEK